LPNLQTEVDPSGLLYLQFNCAAHDRLKSLRLCFDGVYSRHQRWYAVDARAVGDNRTGYIRLLIGDGDRCAGDGASGLIDYFTRDFCLRLSAERRDYEQREQNSDVPQLLIEDYQMRNSHVTHFSSFFWDAERLAAGVWDRTATLRQNSV
jgi:hypothetical protein